MFTDDKSRMRRGVPIKTKDESAQGRQALVQEVAGLCVGKVHRDGGVEFKGRVQALCESLGIVIETNAPYIPQENAIAERGFWHHYWYYTPPALGGTSPTGPTVG